MSFFGINLPELDLSNPESIAGVVLALTTLAGSISTAVTSIQKKLSANAVKFIGRAEEKFEAQETGATKHDYVVNKLYMSIPMMFRPFFPKEHLGKLVNNTFANVSHFTEMRMENSSDSADENVAVSEEASAIENNNTENSKKCKEGDETYDTKTDTSNKQMPCDSFLQDRGVQSTVRVLTLWNRHGVVYRTEYRVRKRKRDGYRDGAR